MATSTIMPIIQSNILMAFFIIFGYIICALDNLLQFLDVACHLLVGNLEVEQVAGKVLGVGCHVDEAVARKVEQDDFLLASLLAFFCFSNGGGNGVAGLRGRDDAFLLGKEQTCLEGFGLLQVNCLHVAVLHKLGDYHTSTMVAKTASVDVGRHEVMAQGVGDKNIFTMILIFLCAGIFVGV